MKKLTASLVVAALFLSIGTTTAFAHGNGCGRGTGTGHGHGTGICTFVDKDGNGVCDTHGADCTFVDADKDGICDYCPNGGVRPQNGTGRRHGGCHRA